MKLEMRLAKVEKNYCYEHIVRYYQDAKVLIIDELDVDSNQIEGYYYYEVERTKNCHKDQFNDRIRQYLDNRYEVIEIELIPENDNLLD